jgi:hypothetical protein
MPLQWKSSLLRDERDARNSGARELAERPRAALVSPTDMARGQSGVRLWRVTMEASRRAALPGENA